MKIFVTGAGGFLGRAVVRRLLDEDCEILAMVRPTSAGAGIADQRLTEVRGDLRQAGDWVQTLASADVVIHCAAAVGGDLAEQFATTVQATETLLRHLPGGLRRFVHVSSFSVYDYSSATAGSTITEDSPIEPEPQLRDAYTWTKLLQERLVRDHAAKHDLPLSVIRPGAIYGPGKDWDYGAAMRFGRVDLLFAPMARFRLTHVDNCADAIVLAAFSSSAGIETYNVVDDDLPTHRGFRRLAGKYGARRGPAIWVPWLLVALAGKLVALVNRVACGGTAKLPEFLAYRRQQARWRPMRYSNQRLKNQLGWSPRVGFADGVKALIAKDPGE